MDDCLSCEDRLECYEKLAQESRKREKVIEYYKAQTEYAEEESMKHLAEASDMRKQLEMALLSIDVLRRALRLTQEYVGDNLLPPVAGWDWYDALEATKQYDKQ